MSVFKHKRKSDNRERFFDSACTCQKKAGVTLKRRAAIVEIDTFKELETIVKRYGE